MQEWVSCISKVLTELIKSLQGIVRRSKVLKYIARLCNDCLRLCKALRCFVVLFKDLQASARLCKPLHKICIFSFYWKFLSGFWILHTSQRFPNWIKELTVKIVVYACAWPSHKCCRSGMYAQLSRSLSDQRGCLSWVSVSSFGRSGKSALTG